jgi:ribulose-phosphate 3-epimerase
LQTCKKNDVDFGLALKPKTLLDEFEHYYVHCAILLIMSIEPGFGGQKFMPQAVERIARAKQIRENTKSTYKISVDGGINTETAKLCISAGVDILVAGTAVFNSEDPASIISQLMGE